MICNVPASAFILQSASVFGSSADQVNNFRDTTGKDGLYIHVQRETLYQMSASFFPTNLALLSSIVILAYVCAMPCKKWKHDQRILDFLRIIMYNVYMQIYIFEWPSTCHLSLHALFLQHYSRAAGELR